MLPLSGELLLKFRLFRDNYQIYSCRKGICRLAVFRLWLSENSEDATTFFDRIKRSNISGEDDLFIIAFIFEKKDMPESIDFLRLCPIFLLPVTSISIITLISV